MDGTVAAHSRIKLLSITFYRISCRNIRPISRVNHLILYIQSIFVICPFSICFSLRCVSVFYFWLI